MLGIMVSVFINIVCVLGVGCDVSIVVRREVWRVVMVVSVLFVVWGYEQWIVVRFPLAYHDNISDGGLKRNFKTEVSGMLSGI